MPVLLDKLLMVKFILILLASLAFTFVSAIPFINFLYRLKFKSGKVTGKDIFGRQSEYLKIQGHKVGTPIGGGILMIFSISAFLIIFYSLTRFSFNWTSHILFLTLIIFGILGFYDDAMKMLRWWKRGKIFNLSFKWKFSLQWLGAFVISYLIYSKIGVSSVSLPLMGILNLGWFFIPWGAFVIVASTNAFNITDGMDGLSTGLLLIVLAPMFYLASFSTFGSDIGVFITVLVGTLLAFLYFNIYPARLFMGDTGALAFGALLGAIALIIGQSFAIFILGAVFYVEAATSALQIFYSLATGGKRIFKIAPLHHHFEALGWPETKVTMRFWLAGAFFATLGLLVALL